uniref:acid sphingomyelinase-like phosphodiesterase 3a isoform X3 n=1 Tax=Gasterosteus aculeatus aculeatus TaxID=481459 RepID=UPI001A99E4E8|nr:acid sphingomyelinase-like phosphodiesterase 3a isoform X3 [Gasterosteus aculeatus aculeatus]
MAHLVRVVLLLCAAAPVGGAPPGSGYLPAAGRFWHITDLHLDPSYHLSPDPTKVCYSSKGAPATHAGPFGDFLCDSPYALIQSAFAHMAPLTRPQDFIIWTGDSPPHVPAGELSTDAVVQVIGNMTQTIRQHFPNLTVYPALGNHDYWPQDQMPDSSNAIYEAAAQLWKPWLQPEALLTLSQGGFYSQLAKPGLRVLSLNTILYYGPNRATENVTDPAGQFRWLEATLQKAARSREKAGVRHRSRTCGVPALRQGHPRREGAPQRAAGRHLQGAQRRRRGTFLRPHPPGQRHGAAGPTRQTADFSFRVTGRHADQTRGGAVLQQPGAPRLPVRPRGLRCPGSLAVLSEPDGSQRETKSRLEAGIHHDGGFWTE